jgi:hypothetical protein
MTITAVGSPDPDDEPEFKSSYEGYVPHSMDPKDMDIIANRIKKERQAWDRLQKTGDIRHPNTIRSANNKAAASWYHNQYSRTNAEGDVINPADASACNQASRYGSFSHGNNSCGCEGC